MGGRLPVICLDIPGDVAAWNTRNVAAREMVTRHEDERLLWVAECADRAYREDDELAIKAGK